MIDALADCTSYKALYIDLSARVLSTYLEMIRKEALQEQSKLYL